MNLNLLNDLSDEAKVEVVRNRVRHLVAERQKVSMDSDPVKWIEKEFYVPELKGPLILQKYQKVALREALRRDATGQLVYSTVVWSDIKKSIKSTIAAAVGLWRGFSLEWGQIIVIANDLKQADSRVGFYMRRAIELNPKMRAMARVRNYMTELPNRTSIESVAIDPTGEAGSNADMVIFSELWGAHEQAQQRMWTEMTLPPAKYGHSQRWVETYAGYSGESQLLEQLYYQGVKEGRLLKLGIPGLEAYANDRARLFVLWNTTPRNPWQTDDYYAQESAVLPPDEFQRVHRNQWISAAQSFVPPEWWDACKVKELPPVGKYEQFVFGIDAGVSSDCFAIVGVTKHDGKIVVRYARAWVPPAGRKLDFAPIEVEIRRIAKHYKVVEFAYDEYQLHDMMRRLSREAIGWFNPFPQSTQRAIADKQFQDMIRATSIQYDNQPDLTEHVKNANARTEGDKLRIVKRAEHLKIDLAVAASMASFEAARLNIE